MVHRRSFGTNCAPAIEFLHAGYGLRTDLASWFSSVAAASISVGAAFDKKPKIERNCHDNRKFSQLEWHDCKPKPTTYLISKTSILQD